MSSQSRPLALVTGGHGELARAIADRLVGAGFEVLSPGRDELDVADPGSAEAYFAGQADDRLELLVNNAGLRRDRPLGRMTEGEWDEVLGVNLRGAFSCARLAFRGFTKRRSGHVVNIGSYSALAGPAGQTNYAAAKAGLIGFTKSLAAEGGRRGVRANCVLPGWLETKFTEDVAPAVRERALAEHALGRFNSAADAAAFIEFLHTGMPAVSGQVFQLDSRVGRWV